MAWFIVLDAAEVRADYPDGVAYLDHAATTPVIPEVREAVLAAMADGGNASSVHASGRRARRLVEESRESLAAALGARPSEVVFTSGGTESDNLAVKGLFWARRRPRVIASAIEHHAVLDAVEWLAEHQGAQVTWLPVDHHGRVAPETLARELDDPDGIAFVTVMWANNEVGTVQPVAELAALCNAAGVPFHTDAVQAVGQLPVDFGATGAQALTMSGHKLGGPLGAGALLLDRATELVAQLHGGGQERDVRSGTLNAPLVAGLALAARLAVDRQEVQTKELSSLRDDLVARVRHALPDTVLHGDPVDRLPGNANLGFPGCEGEELLLLLDAQGIEVSTGSACSSGVASPSHVLLAMGVPEPRTALRISLGHTSTAADVDALVAALPAAVERART